MQPGPQAVALAGPVPDDGDAPAVIDDVVQGEIIPVVRGQRLDFQHVIGAGPQADQAGDDQIDVGGVEVVFAVVVTVVALPGAGVGVGRLGDVRLAVLAVRAGV